jgi:hypothetical protein
MTAPEPASPASSDPARPGGGSPGSGGPVSSGPVSSGPVSSGPVSSGPGDASPASSGPARGGPPGRLPAAVPHQPAGVSGHRGSGPAWLLACLAAVGVLAAGAAAGWWFLPFVAGLAGGVAARYGRWRRRAAVAAAIIVAAAGWAVPLLWQAAQGQPVGGTAGVVAALAGLPRVAAVGIAATLLVAVLQTLAGLWLGWSLIPKSPSR